MLNINSLSGLNTSKCKILNFQGKSSAEVKDMSYKNILGNPLKSTPNSDFEEKLSKIPNITSLQKAKTRVSNLSRYLKEDMVGFEIPEYTLKGVTKGGEQWFQKGAEYLLRGSKQGAKEKDFTSIAKNLYGILSTHDNYWKSNEFSDYLSTLEQTPAIKSTKEAVRQLQQKNNPVSFTGLVNMWGYFSPMKAMDKLLNDGCAYTGKPLKFDDPNVRQDKIAPEINASLDHIMPKSWGGPCEDYNYILSSQGINSARGNIDLISFLKGKDDKKRG